MRQPFCAPHPARYQERYNSPGQPEQALRCILIGHNPSEDAWASGHFYSNPSNRFWNLLKDCGILPSESDTPADHLMPYEIGIGFCDLGCEPGNEAARYGRVKMLEWRGDLFERLTSHVERTGKEPVALAFTGKRQWAQLFEPPLSKCQHGLQPTDLRPPFWPFGSTEVWVMPSSSGRAVMSQEQRLSPYRQLARRIAEIPWPMHSE